eukprot:753530-Hanusia_phi.AAC.5
MEWVQNNPPALVGASATSINNAIFVFGGQYAMVQSPLSHEYSNDVYMLDSSSDTWMAASVSGALPVQRSHHAAASIKAPFAALPVAEHWKGFLDDLYSLDTVSMTWSAVHSFGQAIPASVPQECTRDNHASLWGDCFGSSFRRLTLQVIGSELFAGIESSILVRKVDAFDQIIRTGAETLQVFVAKDESLEHNDYISMSGTIIKRLEQGEVLFDLAFKVTFTSLDTQSKTTSVDSHPLVYAQGVDEETFQIIRSTTHLVRLQGNQSVCPAGYVLSLSSSLPAMGGCQFCGAGTYSVDPFLGGPGCIPCPVGGVCEGGGVNVSFPIGKWALEEGVYRLHSCPAGHYPVRDESRAVRDDCAPCAYGTYSVTWQLVNESSGCRTCPASVMCLGGGEIRAKRGFYIANAQGARRADSEQSQQATLVVYR